MIHGKRVLAVIPARGGSKGIKNKNIALLCGKPLIAYSIEAARMSRYVDEVLVTTDSMEIAECAKKHGAYVPFLRPSELASDTARTIDAVFHVVNWIKDHAVKDTDSQDPFVESKDYDILVLLQPTSPLRTVDQIDGALEWFEEHEEQALASVSPVEQHPILMRTIKEDGTVQKLLQGSSTIRRQEMPSYYYVNGSIYINRMEEITAETSFNDNPLAYVMPRENSVDIDEAKDLYLAEYLLRS